MTNLSSLLVYCQELAIFPTIEPTHNSTWQGFIIDIFVQNFYLIHIVPKMQILSNNTFTCLVTIIIQFQLIIADD